MNIVPRSQLISEALEALSDCGPDVDCEQPLRRCLAALDQLDTVGGYAEAMKERVIRKLEKALWCERWPKRELLISGAAWDIEHIFKL